MIVKTTFLILLILLIFSYVGAFINFPAPFIIFLALLQLFIAWLIATKIIWKLIPKKIRKNYEAYKGRVIFILFAFFICGYAVNRYIFPSKFHPISLIGNLGILVFVIFLLKGIRKPKTKKRLFISTAIFALFIFLLLLFQSNVYTNIDFSSTDAIKTLPYLTWVPIKETATKTYVTKYDKNLSFKGLNLYCPRNLPVAYIIDMSGKPLHSWSAKIDEDDSWLHVDMYKNGDLLAILKDKALVKLDWDSNVKWIKKMKFHHDISIAENGDIYILTRKGEIVFHYGLPIPVVNDYLVIMSPEAKVKKEISLFKVLKKEVSLKKLLIYMRRDALIRILEIARGGFALDKCYFDILHNNTIKMADRDISGVCKKGDVLISACRLNLIGILNIEDERLIWHWGSGDLDAQHHPTFLKNGNILIFDNGMRRKYSRVIELNPLTKDIIWKYEAYPREDFYSLSRGSSQRLPNGNTLITESDNGRVFEITKDGKIVWEFYNPEITDDSKKRSAIYRMMRIINLEDYSELKRILLNRTNPNSIT
ncbi:arylsulfotransferase family protein [Candidatus Omnitrophota bacterium]